MQQDQRSILLLIAAFFVCSNQVSAADTVSYCTPEDLAQMTLAFEHSWDGIYVFSGKGKRVLRLGPKPGSRSRPVDPVHSVKGELPKGGISYFAPEVSPDQQRLACVRCEGIVREASVAPDCEIAVVDLATGESRVAYKPATGSEIDEPTWSPDGKRIAFFLDQDVVVADSHTGDVVQVFEKLRMWTTGAHYAIGLRGDFLGWSDNLDEVYIEAELPDSHYPGPPWQATNQELVALGLGTVQAIGVIRLSVNEVEWLGAFMVPDDGHFHQRLPDGQYQPGPVNLLKHPAVAYFNGAPENPVRFLGRLVWSPGRSCYFYQASRDGWSASTWIEGYDVNAATRFRLRTLSRSLYRK